MSKILRKSKKIWLFLTGISIFLASCFFLIFGNVDTQSQKSFEQQDSKQRIEEQENCSDKPLVIEIDGHKIKAKREGLQITVADRSSITNFEKKCDVEKISNALAANWPSFAIIKKDFPTKTSTTIQNYNAFISGKAKYKPEILDNGTKKYQTRTEQIFVLPIQENATLDQQSVVIRCGIPEHDQKIRSTTNCDTRYNHVSSLSLHYRFFRKNYNEDEFVQLDQKIRQKLESMIISNETTYP